MQGPSRAVWEQRIAARQVPTFVCEGNGARLVFLPLEEPEPIPDWAARLEDEVDALARDLASRRAA